MGQRKAYILLGSQVVTNVRRVFKKYEPQRWSSLFRSYPRHNTQKGALFRVYHQRLRTLLVCVPLFWRSRKPDLGHDQARTYNHLVTMEKIQKAEKSKLNTIMKKLIFFWQNAEGATPVVTKWGHTFLFRPPPPIGVWTKHWVPS